MYSAMTDKTLTCADCGQDFTFTASEQQFYADRQFSEPRRCATCRAVRKAARGGAGNGGSSYGNGGYSSGGGGYDRAPREMFSAKPVYCSDCFSSQRERY